MRMTKVKLECYVDRREEPCLLIDRTVISKARTTRRVCDDLNVLNVLMREDGVNNYKIVMEVIQ